MDLTVAQIGKKYEVHPQQVSVWKKQALEGLPETFTEGHRRADLPPPPLEEHEVVEMFDRPLRRNVIDLRNRLHLELLYNGLRISESTSL